MVGRFLARQRHFILGMTLWASFLLAVSPSLNGQQIQPGRTISVGNLTNCSTANSVLQGGTTPTCTTTPTIDSLGLSGGHSLVGTTANITELRNGATAQALRVYNTYTDASNYESLRFGWSANVATFGTTSAGSGTLRTLQLEGAWNFLANGHINAVTDNSFNIGASITTFRPANIWAGTSTCVGPACLFATAPTVSSGFGTNPVISGGAASFTVNVGTGGTATGGVLAMPTATNGWGCTVTNQTAVAANRANQWTVQTASTQTTVTVQNQTISTGAALAWTASDILSLVCIAR